MTEMIDKLDSPDYDEFDTQDNEGVDIEDLINAKETDDDKDDKDDVKDGNDEKDGGEPPETEKTSELKAFEEKMAAIEQRAIAAEQRATRLEAERHATRAPKEEKPDFKNLNDLAPEEIQRWADEDPKGYAANLLKQAKWELSQDFRKEQAETQSKQAIDKTFDKWAETHSDFMDHVNDGSILNFIQKNPGHNAFSAHLVMKMEKLDTEYAEREKAAVEKAVKEAEEKWKTNLKNKRASSGLKDGPANAPKNAKDSILKNPKKFGFPDDTTALLARHKERLKG